MLIKLRIKLVLINLISLTLILLMLFSTVYIILYNILLKQENDLLARFAADDMYKTSMPPPPEDLGGFADAGGMESPAFGMNEEIQDLSIFYARKNKAGNIFYISPNIISDDSIVYLVDKTDKTGKLKGKIDLGEVRLSYFIMEKDYGRIYVYTERAYREDVLFYYLILSCSGILFSILSVFGISMYLSSKAIRPIKESIEKQDTFIADASHELRTPLAVIRSNLELVMDSPESSVAENDKWLGYMHDEVVRMGKITESLLTLSKSGSHSDYKTEHLNISELLRELYANLTQYVISNNLEFVQDIKENIFMTVSGERFSQLITIFIDNAVKYTKEGYIKLSLYTSAKNIIVSIKDSGIGISDKDKEKIFERFYRVDKSRSRASGGTGLGLSIAKQIINDYGGKIDITGSIGEGSEFILTFPK